jgi:predicted Rossmann fold flavoprotein
MIFDQIIIGGGAAGLFAAANSTCKTLILEKKANAGNKLLIAGQGRCNFTHIGRISDFFSHYGDNANFIKHALKKYTNNQLIGFFLNRGLEITEDKNGKLFPQSGKSSDILQILMKECKRKGHIISLNEAVKDVCFNGGHFLINSVRKQYHAKKIIITTGGMSYPATGSTGDGYSFAKSFGHSIVAPKPSLSPVFVRNYEFQDLAGISIKECQVSLYRDNKKIRSHSGDIGFTHKGLSGPGIIDFSRFIGAGDTLKLNICKTSLEEFNNQFLNAVKENGKSNVQIFLRKFDIPKNLMHNLLLQISIDPAEKIGNINKELRKSMAEKFCELPFEVERVGGFNVAMATSGGVSLNEVSPKTMESKLQPGLFFAGEVLDIDGDTGGYNLQAAFSMGYVAAQAQIP